MPISRYDCGLGPQSYREIGENHISQPLGYKYVLPVSFFNMSIQNELVPLIEQLVSIDSINPDLIAGAAGEATIAQFVANWAREAGLAVEIQPVADGRPNVIITARGSGGGKSLMLNAHMDTVGVTGMTNGLAPRVEGNRLYGRGSYDMKASLAACLITAKRAKALNLRGDVIVTAVSDEEVASIGTQAICRDLARWRPDAVIVTEPTEMEIAVAHKGFVWFDIETFGMAAHGSRPHLGVDAIVKMGKVLTALEQLDLHLRAEIGHSYLGSGSIHASLINGGQELSSYPAHCKLQVERRTLPSENAEIAEAQLQAILNNCAAADAAFKATLTRGLVRDAFEVPETAPIVQLCVKHVQNITGNPAKIGGVSFWADSAFFASAGVPTLLLGPRGFGAHGVVEWVDLDTVHQCADIYLAVAQAFCN